MPKPSYRLVNFRLRPAKSAERKMIVELCGRLQVLSDLASYRYIGLGSPFFNDFVLIHRQYGINNMICIEREELDKDRFVFNKPFQSIELHWGESTAVLPKLQWRDVPSIIWLDYDDPLNVGMLADIGTIVANVEAGSLLLFTLRAYPVDFGKKESVRLDALKDALGTHVPIDVSDTDLRGKAFQRIIRRIFSNEIRRILAERNADLPEPNRLLYDQLMNTIYSDGVRMTTLGGIFHRADQRGRLAECEFDGLAFVNRNENPYQIKVPSLTFKEQRHMNAQLPSVGSVTSPGVPPGDVKAYTAMYRYFPTFAEAEL